MERSDFDNDRMLLAQALGNLDTETATEYIDRLICRHIGSLVTGPLTLGGKKYYVQFRVED